MPDYVTARLNLSYRLTPHITAGLDAGNLFDAYYRESSFSNVWITPGAPRTIRVRISLTL